MSVFTNQVLIDGQPITVDGSGVTQPVSGTVAVSSVAGTVTVDGSGVTQPVSGTVAVSSVAGSVAVTGTFWQATQPVSGTVAVSSVAGTVTVDGSGVTQPVSGTVAVSSVAGSVAVTGPLTDTQLRATPVPVSGTVSVVAGGTGLATVSRVAVDNTAASTLSASNSAKVKVIVYNEGGTLYVKLGSTASSTDYSYRMTADSTLEISEYYGIVTARKASGSTFAQVTEVGI